jgi:hypothetical protein
LRVWERCSRGFFENGKLALEKTNLPAMSFAVNHHQALDANLHPKYPHQMTRDRSSPPLLSPGTMRWLTIAVRTGHIAVSAVLFGGLMLAVEFVRLSHWHLLTIVTGMVLLGLEWLHDRRWPHRGKGVLALLHVGLCLLIHALPQLSVMLLWLIVVSGGIGSHMPRRYRHWSIFEGWESRDDSKPLP